MLRQPCCDSRAVDEYSGTSYEHRRAWIEDKVLWLSSVFAIGIYAYAVMKNHVHLLLRVDKDKASSCSDKRSLTKKTIVINSPFINTPEIIKHPITA